MLIKTKKNVAYSLEQPLSTVPLEPILAKRPPTAEDRTDIGRMWIDQVNEVPYVLVSISNLGVARWVTFGGEYDSLETITGNTGGAVPGDVNDNINVIGTNVLTFDGNIANNTIEASLVNGTDGQLLIGGGAQPTWANLTSSDGSITIDNGPNSIDLTLVGIDGETFTGNTGDAVSPIAGNVNIVGDNVLTVDGDNTTGTLTTSLVNGADGQVLIGGGAQPTWANLTSSNGSIAINNGPNSIDLTFGGFDAETFTGNTGDVVSPIAGNVNILGNNLLRVSGVSSTGTLTISFVNGTSGQVILAGSGSPAWGNLISTDSSILISNGPGFINLRAAPGGGGGSGNSNYFAAKTPGIVLRTDGSTQTYLYGTRAVEIFPGNNFVLNVDFDVAGNFFPGNGLNAPAKYTAPTDGIYQFAMALRFRGISVPKGFGAQVEGFPNRFVGLDLDPGERSRGSFPVGFCQLIRLFAGESVVFFVKYDFDVQVVVSQISGMRVGDI